MSLSMGPCAPRLPSLCPLSSIAMPMCLVTNFVGHIASHEAYHIYRKVKGHCLKLQYLKP